MHPEIERELALQRVDELRAAGAATSRPPRVRRRAVESAPDVVIRAARDADGQPLAALAALDGVQAPLGPALVAEVGGSIRAALPLNGDRAFADPFQRSADLVALLEARAKQLGGVPRVNHAWSLGWLAPAVLRKFV